MGTYYYEVAGLGCVGICWDVLGCVGMCVGMFGELYNLIKHNLRRCL